MKADWETYNTMLLFSFCLKRTLKGPKRLLSLYYYEHTSFNHILVFHWNNTFQKALFLSNRTNISYYWISALELWYSKYGLLRREWPVYKHIGAKKCCFAKDLCFIYMSSGTSSFPYWHKRWIGIAAGKPFIFLELHPFTMHYE